MPNSLQKHAHAGRNRPHMRQAADGHGIVVRQLFAVQHLRCRPAKLERLQMVGKDDVGAHLLHQPLHIRVEAAHHGRDRDHRHHADDDAKDRQRRTHLVGHQRGQCHAEIFGKNVFANVASHRYNSNRSATIGSRLAALRAG